MASDWVHGDAIILCWGLEDFELNDLLQRGELEAYDKTTGKRYINIDTLEKRVETSLEKCEREEFTKQSARTMGVGSSGPPATDDEIRRRAKAKYDRQKPIAIVPEGCIPVSFEISDSPQETATLFTRNRKSLFKCKHTVAALLKNGFQVIQQPSPADAVDTSATAVVLDSPADQVPLVAEGQDAPVVEAQTAPQAQTPAMRDKLKELGRRMRAEGKTDIEIAVALFPADCTVWVNGQERLGKKALKKERNRLEKKVGRLLPRAD